MDFREGDIVIVKENADWHEDFKQGRSWIIHSIENRHVLLLPYKWPKDLIKEVFIPENSTTMVQIGIEQIDDLSKRVDVLYNVKHLKKLKL